MNIENSVERTNIAQRGKVTDPYKLRSENNTVPYLTLRNVLVDEA